VPEQTLDEVVELVGATNMFCVQGENDEVHDQISGYAIEETTDEEVVAQECESAAGEAIDGSDTCGNEKVEKEAQKPRSDAAVVGIWTEEMACDPAADTPSDGDKGTDEVECAGNSSADKNRQQGASCPNPWLDRADVSRVGHEARIRTCRDRSRSDSDRAEQKQIRSSAPFTLFESGFMLGGCYKQEQRDLWGEDDGVNHRRGGGSRWSLVRDCANVEAKPQL
jgi:hypothetical protein